MWNYEFLFGSYVRGVGWGEIRLQFANLNGWLFRKCFAFESNALPFNSIQFFLKVLFLLSFLIFWCSDLRSERSVFPWSHGCGVSRFYVCNLLWIFFSFGNFVCGKDVFGCPENRLVKEKFCFWIWIALYFYWIWLIMMSFR